MTIKDKFLQAVNTTSDINEHLHTLVRCANQCNTVTEFGARTGNSTVAFIYSNCKVFTTYDIRILAEILQLQDSAKSELPGKKVSCIAANTLKIEIDPTDLLFIDTDHTYLQASSELKIHAHKVSKYIILHDTSTFGYKDIGGNGPGIMPAVTEFVDANKEWSIVEQYTNNNGLTILGRSKT